MHLRSVSSVLGIAALYLGVAIFCPAQSQSIERRFEVGGQFFVSGTSTQSVTLNSSGAGISLVRSGSTTYGFGGRVAYNISNSFSVESEVSISPRKRLLEGGGKVQILAGVKVGRRLDKFGVFAKIRPGITRDELGDYILSPGSLCGAITPTPISCFEPRPRTNFSLDAGGVIEVYPSARTILRFDVGDSIVRRGARVAAALKEPPSGTFGPTLVVGVPVAAETTHNFHLSMGFGVRF